MLTHHRQAARPAAAEVRTESGGGADLLPGSAGMPAGKRLDREPPCATRPAKPVIAALDAIAKIIPFPILCAFDNGSEFINHHL
ncbi:hypothetical protein [Rhodococcus koreensis]